MENRLGEFYPSVNAINSEAIVLVTVNVIAEFILMMIIIPELIIQF